MSIRKPDGYRNYSEQELAELRQSQIEEDASFVEFNNESAKRATAVVTGLISKYGFSEAGAKKVLSMIEQQKDFSFVNFATPEMKAAAIKANEYYWK